jgi:hypothetical protein
MITSFGPGQAGAEPPSTILLKRFITDLGWYCQAKICRTGRITGEVHKFAARKRRTIKVPTDDYRAIRRAILDLDEFENRSKQMVPKPDSAASPAEGE